MFPRSRPLLCALCVALLLCPATASAQSSPSDEPSNSGRDCSSSNELECMLTTSSNAGTSSAYVYLAALVITSSGAAITTVYFVMQQGAQQNERALNTYISIERDALHQAHALGAGQAVDDMATLLWIPHERALLGAMMRARRDELDAALMEPCEGAASCAQQARRYISILLDEAIHRDRRSLPSGNKDMRRREQK